MSTFNKYRTKGAYHWDWYETEDWYKECVDECVEFCKGSTIDVGCGDGLLLSKLPKRSLGLDNDIDALMLSQDRGLNVTGTDLDDPRTITDVFGKYDYVSCLNTIEHLKDTTTLINLIRGAKKGAIIITIDWQGGAFGEDHKHEYTYKELLDFFREFNPEGFRLKDYPEWIGVKIRK